MALWISQILTIVYVVINTLVFGPYCAYQTHIFNKQKASDAYLFNRKPNMVVHFSITCLITLTIISPISYSVLIFLRPTQNEIRGAIEFWPYLVVLLSIFITFSLACRRAWHMWFDAKHKTEQATNTWAQHLNDEKQMFAKLKDTLGNDIWTRNWGIVLLVILIIISVAVTVTRPHLIQIVQGIVCVAICIFWALLLALVWGLSRVKDTIDVRAEFVIMGGLGIAFGICYTILWVISHDWAWKPPDSDRDDNTYDVLYLVLPSIFLYLMILVQTQWVLFKMNKVKDAKRRRAQSLNDENITLKTIISDVDGYKELMEFLVKCVSVENLLFVTECIPFLAAMTEQYAVAASTIQLRNYLENYELPADLPVSPVNQVQAITIRFLFLCEKYVMEHSDFEINISHRNRRLLTDIYHHFEEKIDEMEGKISKLNSLFGDAKVAAASRRASSAILKSTEMQRTKTEESNIPAIREDQEVEDVPTKRDRPPEPAPALKTVASTTATVHHKTDTGTLSNNNNMNNGDHTPISIDDSVHNREEVGPRPRAPSTNVDAGAEEKIEENVYGFPATDERRKHVKSASSYERPSLKLSRKISFQKHKKNYSTDLTKRMPESQISKKNLHSCIEDYQLMPDTTTVQEIYDAFCFALGDVYANLNDSCLRFMDTEMYFRWYEEKKEKTPEKVKAEHEKQ